MRSLASLGAVAIFLTIFVSGCAPSDRPEIAPVRLPPLDPRTEAPCPDPGVEGDYKAALTANRLALAECRRRQQNAVQTYNDARQSLGPQ